MYKLPYTGAEIEERLAKLDNLNAENFVLSETTAELYGLSGVDANVDTALKKATLDFYPLQSFFKNVPIKTTVTDIVYSTNGSFASSFLHCNNLTISSGAIVKPASIRKQQVIIVNDTLTLDGIIDASEFGAQGVISGNGRGGHGGGVLVIYANKIVGSGIIKSDGGTGVTSTIDPGTDKSGKSGESGRILGFTVNGGIGGVYSGGGAIPQLLGGSSIKHNFTNMFVQAIYDTRTDIGGGAGGSGAGNASGGLPGGGSGGAGAYGKGGNSSAMDYLGFAYYGGSGGGGGGAIFLLSNSEIPSITISANGGNASNPPGSQGRAGGGGGGLIVAYSPNVSNISTSVAGGLKSSSGNDGTIPSTNGENGFYYGIEVM